MKTITELLRNILAKNLGVPVGGTLGDYYSQEGFLELFKDGGKYSRPSDSEVFTPRRKHLLLGRIMSSQYLEDVSRKRPSGELWPEDMWIMEKFPGKINPDGVTNGKLLSIFIREHWVYLSSLPIHPCDVPGGVEGPERDRILQTHIDLTKSLF